MEIKEQHKVKLSVFRMTVLRKICRITRTDRRKNLYMLKELLM